MSRLSERLEEVGVSSVSQGSLLLQNISVLQDNIQSKQNNNNNNSNCDVQARSFFKNAASLLIGPVLQREAESLNQTTQVELSSATQTLLLEEVATAVEAMSAVDLAATRAAANQESRCV